MADLFAKVNCTYCQEDINGLRVQCCVCLDFDICLQCFASGAEIGSHKNDHSYKFVDTCAVSIFGGRGSWTGREEMRLLDAMELYGLRNWECVSKHIETRTPEEAREEFMSRYLEGNMGKMTWGEITNNRPILIDHTPEDHGPLSPTIMSKLPPLDITLEEARQLGYMSHRDDYEREYDMAAEHLVSSLALNPIGDNSIEIALKLAQVDMYTRRLRERARRKRVIRDYQLVAKFFSNQRKDNYRRPLTKEQREFRDSMRVFSQFNTSGEHERLIASIERERELRLRLSELLRYRSLGLTSQEEAIHYEQHAAFQKQQQQRQSKAGSSGYELLPPEIPLKNGKSEDDQSSTDLKFTQLQSEEGENRFANSNWRQRDNGPNTSFSFNPIDLLSTNEIQDHLLCNGKSQQIVDEDTCDPFVWGLVTEYLSGRGWLPEVSVS